MSDTAEAPGSSRLLELSSVGSSRDGASPATTQSSTAESSTRALRPTAESGGRPSGRSARLGTKRPITPLAGMRRGSGDGWGAGLEEQHDEQNETLLCARDGRFALCIRCVDRIPAWMLMQLCVVACTCITTICYNLSFDVAESAPIWRGAIFGFNNALVVVATWHLWRKAFKTVLPLPLWRRVVAFGACLLIVSRFVSVATGPVSQVDVSNPDATSLLFRLLWHLFFVINFFTLYCAPALLYGTQARKDRVAGRISSRSRIQHVVTVGAATIIFAYSFLAKQLEVWGIDLVKFSVLVGMPLSVLVVVVDLCYGAELRADPTSIVLLSFFYSAVPIGVGSSVLALLQSLGDDEFSKLVVAGVYCAVMWFAYLLWRPTARQAHLTRADGVPASLLFVWFTQLFFKFVFFSVNPLGTVFFLLLLIDGTLTLTRHSLVHTDVLRWLRAWWAARRSSQEDLAAAVERAERETANAFEQWRLCEQRMFSEVGASVVAIVALIVEWIMVQFGIGSKQLLNLIPDHQELEMFVALALILTVQVGCVALVRRVHRKRLERLHKQMSHTRRRSDMSDRIGQMMGISMNTTPMASEDPASSPEAEVRMVSNPLRKLSIGRSRSSSAERRHARQRTRRERRRFSIVQATWSYDGSMERFWRRYLGEVLIMLAFGVVSALGEVYQLEASVRDRAAAEGSA